MKRFLLIAAIRVLAALPLGLRRIIGSLLGRVFSLISTRTRRVAELQLDLFAGRFGGRDLIPTAYANLGQTLLESLDLKPILERKDAIVCRDEALLQKLLKEGPGIVALTAHTSNWELLAAYVVRRGFRLATFGRTARASTLQGVLAELRARNGVTTLWRSDRSTLRDITRRLQNGEVIAALIDQDTRVSSTLIPFFGRPANTPTALVSIAKKTGAAIVSAFIFRCKSGTFTIFLKQLDATMSVTEILAAYNCALEEGLSLYPAQWVWFHKRWRSLPDGRVLRTDEYIKELQNELKIANS